MYERGWRVAIAAVMVATLTTTASAQHRPVSALNWVFGGTVHTVARAGRVAIVGGRFNAVAPRHHLTGGFAVLSPITSHRALRTARVHGNVNAIVPDGSGGWFVGGNFTFVGDERQPQLVHILADGRADAGWRGRVDGVVFSLAVVGSTLFVGGEFTHAGGGAGPALPEARQNLAAFAAADGALLPAAASGVDGPVLALAAAGTTLYAGGDFATFLGASRARLAAVDTGAGTVTSWNPTADATVRALLVSADGSSIYAGGAFANAGGAGRPHAVQIEAATGLATAWNPSANDVVAALALAGDTVYLGGRFTQVSGAARSHAAAVHRTTGAIQAWDPNADDVVLALSVTGTTVYLGGEFLNLGGARRLHAASVDAVTAVATSWHPALNDPARVIVAETDRVAIGGSFEALGAYPRRNLAAIDLETGHLLPWNPRPDGAVLALEVARDRRLYVGGGFSTIAGQTRARLAAFDLPTWGLASWNPGADAAVLALASFTEPGGVTTVYAGGEFTYAGGQARSHVAAIAGASGLAVPAFTPGVTDDAVLALEVDATHVYAGGRFTSLGASGEAHLGRLARTTGAVDTSWAPAPSDVVRALDLTPGVLYAGGLFTTIASASRSFVAALALTSPATATAWRPNPNRAVNAIDRDGPYVFLGGAFSEIDNVRRPRLGVVIAAGTGAGPYLLAWTPRWFGVVNALDARLEGLLAGGDALPDLDDQEIDPVGRVAFYPRAGVPGRPGPPTAPHALTRADEVSIDWGASASGAEPTGYLLDVGATAGASDIASGLRVGADPSFEASGVPPGRYYLRVRSSAPGGTSTPSEEVVLVVGAAGCAGAPEAPADLDAVVSGSTVTLTWGASPTPGLTAYRIEAGPTGAPMAFVTTVAGSATSFTTLAPAGVFEARVRAIGACGESVASNTVLLAVGGAPLPPGEPEDLEAVVTSNAVAITWTPPPSGGAATGYVFEAGSGPGLSDLARTAVAGPAMSAVGVPAGTYFVRVRAVNGAGVGPASSEIQVVVQ